MRDHYAEEDRTTIDVLKLSAAQVHATLALVDARGRTRSFRS